MPPWQAVQTAVDTIQKRAFEEWRNGASDLEQLFLRLVQPLDFLHVIVALGQGRLELLHRQAQLLQPPVALSHLGGHVLGGLAVGLAVGLLAPCKLDRLAGRRAGIKGQGTRRECS